MSIFGDLLLKLDCVQEALSKKQGLDKISNLDEVIGEHVLKIILFKDDNSYRGHIRSLEGWIKDCQKYFRKCSVRPNKNEVFKALFDFWETDNISTDFKRDVNDLTLKYSNLPKNEIYFDLNKVYITLKNVLLDVAEVITKDITFDVEKIIKNNLK